MGNAEYMGIITQSNGAPRNRRVVRVGVRLALH